MYKVWAFLFHYFVVDCSGLINTDMELKINPAIKHDLLHWSGQPIICKIIITDIKGGKYESEIHLPKDWTQKGFSEAIAKSYLLCDDTPKETYVDYIGPNLKIMN